MDQKTRQQFRYFLKDSIRKTIDFSQTDQSRGVPPPPVEKPAEENAPRIELPGPEAWQTVQEIDLTTAIARRRSCRTFRTDPLSLGELAFLLWATQGVREVAGPSTAFRVVPSAGCRHALETYLSVLRVDGLDEGVYRYLPLEHQLVLVSRPADLGLRTAEAAFGQTFIASAAVTFIWTAIPRRMEWRYDLAAHKVIAIDAGHVCQNLYLACQAVEAGTCAVAAYDQERMDRLVGVDGEDEFVIYLAPAGKVSG
jgi:SagB-type dehydrogenase family enzyme